MINRKELLKDAVSLEGAHPLDLYPLKRQDRNQFQVKNTEQWVLQEKDLDKKPHKGNNRSATLILK